MVAVGPVSVGGFVPLGPWGATRTQRSGVRGWVLNPQNESLPRRLWYLHRPSEEEQGARGELESGFCYGLEEGEGVTPSGDQKQEVSAFRGEFPPDASVGTERGVGPDGHEPHPGMFKGIICLTPMARDKGVVWCGKRIHIRGWAPLGFEGVHHDGKQVRPELAILWSRVLFDVPCPKEKAVPPRAAPLLFNAW